MLHMSALQTPGAQTLGSSNSFLSYVQDPEQVWTRTTEHMQDRIEARQVP
jgi:hypothetical protein